MVLSSVAFSPHRSQLAKQRSASKRTGVSPPYSPDWAERSGDEMLLKAARRRLVQVPVRRARPGDVLLFRMSAGAPVKHCGIIGSDEGPERTLIHAYWGRAVIESWMGDWWTRRIAAAFTWPERKTPSP